MLDLTPGQGELAKACCEKRIKYTGIAMTTKHQEGLRSNLVKWLKGQTFDCINVCVFGLKLNSDRF